MSDHSDLMDAVRAALAEYEAAHEQIAAIRKKRGVPDHVPLVLHEGHDDELQGALDRALAAGERLEAASKAMWG